MIRPSSSRSGAALTRMGISRPSGCVHDELLADDRLALQHARPAPHSRTSTGAPSRVRHAEGAPVRRALGVVLGLAADERRRRSRFCRAIRPVSASTMTSADRHGLDRRLQALVLALGALLRARPRSPRAARRCTAVIISRNARTRSPISSRRLAAAATRRSCRRRSAAPTCAMAASGSSRMRATNATRTSSMTMATAGMAEREQRGLQRLAVRRDRARSPRRSRSRVSKRSSSPRMRAMSACRSRGRPAGPAGSARRRASSRIERVDRGELALRRRARRCTAGSSATVRS